MGEVWSCAPIGKRYFQKVFKTPFTARWTAKTIAFLLEWFGIIDKPLEWRVIIKDKDKYERECEFSKKNVNQRIKKILNDNDETKK